MGEVENIISNYLSTIVDANILAVGIQGGYARGKDYNGESDIDLVFVFNSDKEGGSTRSGSFQFNGAKLEVRHIYLNKLEPEKWPPKIRYIYSCETKIYCDKYGILDSLIKDAEMKKEEQEEIIVYAIRKFGTRGITYKSVYKNYWKGFYWDDPAEYWILKGDYISAHSRLNECNNLLLMLIFAINNLFLPSPKWRYHILQNLNWLPDNFIDLYKKTMCYKEMDNFTFETRKEAYLELLNKCVDEAERIGALPIDFGKFYKDHIQVTNDNTSQEKFKIWKE